MKVTIVLLMTLFVRAYSAAKTPASMKTKALLQLDWRELSRNCCQLDPKMTLIMGQCFNWNKLALSKKEDVSFNIWVGVVDGRAIAIKSHGEVTSYAPLISDAPKSKSQEGELKEYLRRYFQLEHDLEELYTLWGQGCPRMNAVTNSLPGVRVLRQDPWECLISFICSSNNNIKRITLMLDRLKRRYGNYVCSVVRSSPEDDFKVVIDPRPPVISANTVPQDIEVFLNQDSANTIHLFDFPTIEDLARAEEADLRALGMGYRAKFIKGTAEKVLELGGLEWLEGLRTDSREKFAPKLKLEDEDSHTKDDSPIAKVAPKRGAKKKKNEADAATTPHRLWVNEQLQMLPGVGRKVADCVAVFSLDQTESIPVDVHVWDIAVRDYSPDLQRALSLTPAIYEQVGDLFRERFKSRAGWAHSVLFAAELPEFKQMLPDEMQREMDLFDAQQRRLKTEKRNEAKKRKDERQIVDELSKAQRLGDGEQS